jgi:hypothetical protein
VLTRRLRRPPAGPAARSPARGIPPRTSARDPRVCSARCRTVAMPGQQAGDDSARTGIPAAPNLSILSLNSAECTVQVQGAVPCRCRVHGAGAGCRAVQVQSARCRCRVPCHAGAECTVQVQAAVPCRCRVPCRAGAGAWAPAGAPARAQHSTLHSAPLHSALFQAPTSPAWCRTSRADTMKITSSATLVA